MHNPLSCKLCGASGTITLPDDIAIRTVQCSACAQQQPVNHYASGGQQLLSEMARLQHAKADRENKLQQGVTCSACGGTMELPSDPQINSFACLYCRKQHLVSAFLDPKLLANMRLRNDVNAHLDDVRSTQAAAQGRERWVVFGLIAMVFLVVIIVALTRG